MFPVKREYLFLENSYTHAKNDYTFISFFNSLHLIELAESQ